ncbi:MAG TPA: glycoside hydrolase family 38 C-terminal domain-containing protein [Roseiflexaceae bacterium]|nr:glycoside hydrolase family 38 C-terminal domain-containing protein [Roseiflexaceae bacterium]
MKHNILHMIGNAHLDPVWLWTWQEGFQEAKATFRSALDRMRESEDFVFTSSSAALYEWVERNDPAMFAEIRARVAEGRWRIVGGWWIQPDCNLPCGESFARQGLYGQRYFRSRFGVTARVGYNVDSFGHHAMLPQILRLSGMDSYVFTRPEPHEKGLPGRLFWWESDDGARVLAFRIPFEYATWGQDLERYVRRCVGEFRSPLNELMCFYGVGNHGGGPTRENIASIRRMAADPDLPTLRFSAPDQFFDAVRAGTPALPVVHDELQHHAAGCYAAHSGVKRWNRRAEQALLAAERFAAIAELLCDLPYPRDFDRAWKNVLFNQFHDILAGTSLEAAYEDARDQYGEALSIAGRALNDALQAISWRIDIPEQPGARPLVVFNPHAWPCRVPVELDFGRLSPGDRLVDETGAPVPHQAIRPGAVISGWRSRLLFLADLPPLGYRVYRVLPPETIRAAPEDTSYTNGTALQGREAAEAAPDHSCSSWAVSDTVLENEWLRLELDVTTGGIGLRDKRCGVDVFCGPAALPVVIDDPSDTWGHGVYQFQDVVGTFAPIKARLAESGPVRAMLRVESAYGDSRMTQEFLLYREQARVDVRVTLDWRERRQALKLRFPVNLNFVRATYEIPFGHIERAACGQEEPGQSWVDLSGVARGAELPYGLSLLNDSKYSFDVRGRELSLTVLRSPVYAHHDPTQPSPDEPYSVIDQGRQSFCYALLPHQGGWEVAGTPRRAAELNQPALALAESFHAGPLPQRAAYLAVDCDNIAVSAFKRAEEGDDLILRCYETHKTAARARICLPLLGRRIEADFRPCEIKTFRIPRDPALPVVETDLIES